MQQLANSPLSRWLTAALLATSSPMVLAGLPSWASQLSGTDTIELAQEIRNNRQPTVWEGSLGAESATLEDKSYYDAYTFEGEVGEIITIELSSNEFDTATIEVAKGAN